jgi:drug/metabolite transporter (DMT)-like permease
MAPLPVPPRRALLIASYAAVCIVWGSTYYAIRIALEGFPPFLIGAMRFLAAGTVLLVVARARGEALPRAREWAGALVTGTLFFALGNGLVNLAEQSVSSGLASVLVATMPLWATAWARLFGERPSAGEVLGVGLGLVGVAILELGGELRASPLGALFLVLAPMSWALGSLASKRLPAARATFARTGSQMLAGGTVMLLVSAGVGERAVANPSTAAILAVLYLAILGSLVGFTAFSYLLAHTRPAVATSYAYVNPVIAVGLGVALAGERFGVGSAVGALVILGAVGIVARARSSASYPAPRPAPPASVPCLPCANDPAATRAS